MSNLAILWLGSLASESTPPNGSGARPPTGASPTVASLDRKKLTWLPSISRPGGVERHDRSRSPVERHDRWNLDGAMSKCVLVPSEHTTVTAPSGNRLTRPPEARIAYIGSGVRFLFSAL